MYDTKLPSHIKKIARKKKWTKNNKDYDINGYILETYELLNKFPPKPKKGIHLTDVYKKPWHPTFSTQSKYHEIGKNEGGTWVTANLHWYFIPGKTNYKYHTKKQLKKYWKHTEKANGNILVLKGKNNVS